MPKKYDAEEWNVSLYEMLTANQLEPYVAWCQGAVVLERLADGRFNATVNLSPTQQLVGQGDDLHTAIIAALQFYPVPE